jgi:hypothetical protein
MSGSKDHKHKQAPRPRRQQLESVTNGKNTATLKSSASPKFITLAPLTVRLRHDQVVMLTDFERKIMSQRDREQRRERITKSTIIRVLIDLLPDLLTDMRGIADESALSERLRMIVAK